MTEKRWYPWLVAIITMLCVVCSNGIGSSGITVFDERLLNEFGWSVGELKIRDSINYIGAAVLVVFSGWFLDRSGFKPLLLLGLGLITLVFLSYPHASSLGGLYARHGVLAIGVACAGNMVAMLAAASWMPERRALAMGIAIAGTSVGGMTVPPLANYLGELYGWRGAMTGLAALPALVFVAVLLLVRSHSNATVQTQKRDRTGIDFSVALKTPQFYLVGVAGVTTFFAVLGLVQNLFLYQRGLGIDPATAAFAFTIFSAAAFSGKLLAGYLGDRVNPYWLIRVCMIIMLSGYCMVTWLPEWLRFGLVVTGFGWGSLHTLYNYLLIALFGMKSAGRINGSISAAEAAGAGLGVAICGYLFDLRGDYSLAFTTMIAVLAFGTFLTMFLRPMQSHKASVGVSPRSQTELS